MESRSGADSGKGGEEVYEYSPMQDSGQSESLDAEPDRSDLNPIDRQYAAIQGDVPRRIHIIGTGSIGKLVAHSIRGVANPPPVTLMLHKWQLYDAWEKGSKQLTIQDEDFKVSRGGFEVELMPPRRAQHGVEVGKGPSVYDVAGDSMAPHKAAELMGEHRRQEQERVSPENGQSDEQAPAFDRVQSPSEPQQHPRFRRSSRSRSPRQQDLEYTRSNEPIHNLIVTTKAAFTVAALSTIKHRLSRNSTICFLQNGMGVIDEVNAKLFPTEEERPSYVQGIITHGVNVPPEIARSDPFFAVHAGHGTIALGVLPRKPTDLSVDQDGKETQDYAWAPSARYILRTLTRTPVLCAVGFTPTELLQQQLEKVAVNSVLNPLTSLIDARNGTILYNFALTRTMRLLLAETSLVIRSLPELRSIPNIGTRFSAERLETLVVSVTEKTKDNISSMLADVRAGRKTEIEYINGYIVKRGEELGIKCVVNYAIMQTVVGKAQMTQRETREFVPMSERAGE